MQHSDSSNGHQPVDNELLASRAASGDASAFERLVDEHRETVRRFIDLRLDKGLQSRVDASDVVQETFLRVHRQLPRFTERRPMSFRVWIIKTALDLTRDLRIKHLKRERRSVTREIPQHGKSAILLAQDLSRQRTPSEVAMKKEQLQTVAALIGNLRDCEREVLLLRHIEALKFEEIAAILEVTAAAARKRYARALLRLQELCSEKGLSGFK